MCAGQCGQFFERSIMFAQNRSRPVQQTLARFGQQYFPRCAHEQARSGLCFQLPDLHADGRLGNVDALSASRKRAAFRDRYEGP